MVPAEPVVVEVEEIVTPKASISVKSEKQQEENKYADLELQQIAV